MKIYGILKYSPRILKLATSHQIQVGVRKRKWDKDWCEVRKEKLTSIVMFVGCCCQSTLGRSRCWTIRSCRWCEDTREERGGSESMRHSLIAKASSRLHRSPERTFCTTSVPPRLQAFHIRMSSFSHHLPPNFSFLIPIPTKLGFISYFFSFLSSNLIEIVASYFLKY